jgi:hypothetical protein
MRSRDSLEWCLTPLQRVLAAATTDPLRLLCLPLNVIVLLPWTHHCYLEGIFGEGVYSTETLLKLTFSPLLLRKLGHLG